MSEGLDIHASPSLSSSFLSLLLFELIVSLLMECGVVVSVTAAAIIFFLLDLLKDLLKEDMVVVVREGSREISVLIGIKVDI